MNKNIWKNTEKVQNVNAKKTPGLFQYHGLLLPYHHRPKNCFMGTGVESCGNFP